MVPVRTAFRCPTFRGESREPQKRASTSNATCLTSDTGGSTVACPSERAATIGCRSSRAVSVSVSVRTSSGPLVVSIRDSHLRKTEKPQDKRVQSIAVHCSTTRFRASQSSYFAPIAHQNRSVGPLSSVSGGKHHPQSSPTARNDANPTETEIRDTSRLVRLHGLVGDPLQLTAVISEAALLQKIGGPDVLRDLLLTVADPKVFRRTWRVAVASSAPNRRAKVQGHVSVKT
jgi:uncharacterized protein DUF5753